MPHASLFAAWIAADPIDNDTRHSNNNNNLIIAADIIVAVSLLLPLAVAIGAEDLETENCCLKYTIAIICAQGKQVP